MVVRPNAVLTKKIEEVAQTSSTSNEFNAPSFENNTLHVVDTNYVRCTTPNLSENDELPHDLEIENAKSTENPVICGRRIIDLEYFLNALKSLKHEGFGCSFFDLNVLSEKCEGLHSIISFRCSVCNTIEKIRTGNSNINLAAVSGTLATGIGFSQISELFAAMNIPCMANKTYLKYHTMLVTKINCQFEKEASLAAKEEANLAIEAGDVSADGTPIISVIVDGAWSKRSYRTNYNALSGVACIIGAKTKKILYLGIKNKYCCVCMRGSKKMHQCFKNWNGTSTGMEAAIIKDGFRTSLATHKLIYGKLIGDGDSSVHRKLIDAAPYGPTFTIQKIECRNHLLCNYSNKLADLSKNVKYPIVLRKKVSNRDVIGRLRNAVIKAVQYRKSHESQINKSFNVKCDLLGKDIANGPKHIFGDHTDCDQYYCKGAKEGEENLVPQLTSSLLFNAIMEINRRLVCNASSLLHDMDTNAAETFNSIVAKFVGGKRINYSLKNSYEARCKAAAISYNTKGEFMIAMYSLLHGIEPGHHTKLFYQRKRNTRTITKRKRNRNTFASTDEDYGPEAGTPCNDMDAALYILAAGEFMAELGKVDRNLINKDTILQSKSDLWQMERKKRITASNFGRICKLRKTTCTSKTVAALLYSTFKGNCYTSFGLQNEHVAIELFQRQYRLIVEKAGLIVDGELPFLACSPDGITGNNALIEIKSSAKSGNLDPVQAVLEKRIEYCEKRNEKIFLKRSHIYYYQVQGLLHITKRNLCYFVIYTNGGIHVEEIQRDDIFWTERMVKKLTSFYMNCLLPERVDSRRSRGQNIRNVYLT